MKSSNNYKNSISPDKLKIMVCCHKVTDVPDDPYLMPILGGATKIDNIPATFQRDDEVNGQRCDNISIRNDSFCELTSMYWAWKHIKEVYPNIEYVGLNHYRRYFDFEHMGSVRSGRSLSECDIRGYSVNVTKISKILKNKKIILAKRVNYPFSIYQNYAVEHISDDAEKLIAIVHHLYPEYDRSMKDVLLRRNYFSPCNMFLMSYTSFQAYSEWLFSILEYAYNYIDLSGYSMRQGRIFGYYGERLLNVWVEYNHLKSLEMPIIVYGQMDFDSPLKSIVNRSRKDIAYFISRSRSRSTDAIYDRCINNWKLK